MIDLCCVTVKDFGAVEEASEWTCPTATQHLDKGSRWQNCMPIVVVDFVEMDDLNNTLHWVYNHCGL